MANANPMSPDEVRALLDRAADRDLDDLEAKRLEDTLAADPALTETLWAPFAGEELLAAPVEPPSESEWLKIDEGIKAGVARESAEDGVSTGSKTIGKATGSRPRPTLLFPVTALAAAAILCVIVLRMIMTEGLADPESPPIAEVLDLREGASPFIMNLGDDEDGGVIIFVTSS